MVFDKFIFNRSIAVSCKDDPKMTILIFPIAKRKFLTETKKFQAHLGDVSTYTCTFKFSFSYQGRSSIRCSCSRRLLMQIRFMTFVICYQNINVKRSLALLFAIVNKFKYVNRLSVMKSKVSKCIKNYS